MAKVISGKELSAKLKTEMAAQVATFPEKYGRVPHLVVILVGEDPASQSYVKGKAKASEVVGIRNTTILKPADITEEELLDQGIKPNTIRLSIGTENIDDIIQDLDEAFKAIQ